MELCGAQARRRAMISLRSLEGTLLRRLQAPLPGAAAQQRFAPRPPRPGWTPDQQPATARRAAALVLLYARDDEPRVALTVRGHALPHHAGQVSLPGGAIAPGESVEAAALREAEEEIGIATGTVRIIGPLSSLWVPVSNFVIHPVVGVFDSVPAFRLHPGEVSALIEAPVARLCDPLAIRWARRVRGGVEQDYCAFEIEGHSVWGATAMILGEFVSVLGAPDAGSSV